MLNRLAEGRESERGGLEQELVRRTDSVAHIREIVRAQQSLVGAPGVVEPVRLDRLMDDAFDAVVAQPPGQGPDRRRGVVLSSGTTVPGRYESFDLGFSDPPLWLQTTGTDFSLVARNARGAVLLAFHGETPRGPWVVRTEKWPTRPAGTYASGRHGASA